MCFVCMIYSKLDSTLQLSNFFLGIPVPTLQVVALLLESDVAPFRLKFLPVPALKEAVCPSESDVAPFRKFFCVRESRL